METFLSRGFLVRKGRGATVEKVDGQRDGPIVTENEMLAIHFVAACVCFLKGEK